MQWQQLAPNKLTSLFTPQAPPQPVSVLDEFNDITKISLRKRLLLCVILALVGAAFCGLSTMFMLNPRVFAKFYTLGSIMILSSSTLLLGWKRQYASITSSTTRLVAAIIYFSSLFITLYAALGLRSSILALMCILFQLGAALWYMLTYIPMGNSIFFRGMKMMLPI
eukprot:Phypoly_transcript_19327.p1 GENE.Phypoly_transcript_19327~~Phypoly_transcript_19327.p1  ORF type:complete len:167 (+),score=11.65 Phypoly_transcript_19327:103-603(+)